jgi:hypothetical protein
VSVLIAAVKCLDAWLVAGAQRVAFRQLPFLLAGVLLLHLAPARAQLASSFYNVTGLETRVLPNAVQIVIRTDGIPRVVSDEKETATVISGAAPATSFRLRFLNARARLPAFMDIGAYPFDAIRVTPGNDVQQAQPSVELEVRFDVPITVRRFAVDAASLDSTPGATLRAREVGVELSNDGRSIVITAIPDRADAGATLRLRRSPPASYKHRAAIEPVAQGRFRVDALHTPLAQLLAVANRAMRLPFVAAPDVAQTDVSLSLPAATPDEFLTALSNGYDLARLQRTTNNGSGSDSFVIGRAGALAVTERLPLNYLEPEQARLLFPDFLLPSLRVDTENRALLATGTPALVARVRRDLAYLDQPRPQVRVEADIWEFVTARDAALALRAGVTSPSGAVALDSDAGEITMRLEDGGQRAFAANVQALVRRRRARLLAQPFVVVASGATGTLFVGQSRFLSVLRQVGNGQQAEALEVQIGD